MRFYDVLVQTIGLLALERYVTYQALKRQFDIDDAYIEDLKVEIITLRQLAKDHEGLMFVWTGEGLMTSVAPPVVSHTAPHPLVPAPPPIEVRPPPVAARPPAAEHRQLTVMFCDLVGSTDLSQRLDPEDLREVVQAYQTTAAAVITRYEGYIAQYLGDGLLVYFGYPVAHEDDAQRAVYTGVGIPEAMTTLNTRLQADHGVQLGVRIGIHTGPVVVGEMGGAGRHENLALGETPNIAARLEGLAQPNTVVISSVTAQLVQRAFVLEERGLHELKGVAEPMRLYTVISTREAEYDDHEAMLAGGFDALLGRDEEIGLLLRRWEQSKESQGQVVFISGEAGLGKSSLVEGLRAHVRQEGYVSIAFRCSPYTENSALHPVIEHLQRVFDWQPQDSAETKLTKVEQRLAKTSVPMEESVPLITALISLPLPEGRYIDLNLTPQQQRQQTHDTLVAWLLDEAERQPLLVVWEDLHWADPSTLALLGMFIAQAVTVPMMNVLAYRPVFAPPWPAQSNLTPLVLNRLERSHIEALVNRLSGGKPLPDEVVAYIVTKTDGVPLYVEELTKMLLESDLIHEEAEQYVLTGPLSDATIPATLQDSLMARLDRFPAVKEVAQLGAVLGREFAYEMLQALTSVEEKTLQEGLGQFVDTGLLYQRGRIPRAKYIFRHALIRDAAYQSLLRRTRQHYHEQVAQLLEARFPEVVETQPELVAHHYTEAGLAEPAIDYWQRAGQRACERSAYQEALSHLTTGLTLLQTLPETLARHQQELPLQTVLGTASMIVRGQGAPEVEAAYTRARFLCQQLGDTQDVFPVLVGLFRFYLVRPDLPLARQLGEELLGLAERRDETPLYVIAHNALGATCFYLGELLLAHSHLEEAVARDTPARRSSPLFRAGLDQGVSCRAFAAITLWLLGYPDQALVRAHDGLSLATELDRPFSCAFALNATSRVRQCRREGQDVYDHAEAGVTLSTEQGFPFWLGVSTILQGWALTTLGQREEGLAQMRQGLKDYRTSGAEVNAPYYLTLLAEGYGSLAQVAAGLDALKGGLEVMERTSAHWWQAEVYRLQGALLLQQTIPDVAQAERCFHQALNVARQQQARSLELRAASSLARLWQSQGKCQDAYNLLAPVYDWFTEGFDTADLKDAKTVLEELILK